MDSKALKDEFDFYLVNHADFVAKYLGKFVVLKNHEVIGSYYSNIEAHRETEKVHEVSTFLIQFVQEGRDIYTQTFHSQVFL